MQLKSLYDVPGRVVVTAHRGFSGRYPENTLRAFEEAVKLGVDIVEFDVHATRDGELVIIHDDTLERTTDGRGRVADHDWDELASLNATYWQGPHDTGHRLDKTAGSDGLPRLEEALSLLAGRVGLNIQVKTASLAMLRRIVDLHRTHGLADSAYLMLSTFEQAAQVRAWDSAVPLCVGEARADVARHRAFGVDFCQPSVTSLQADGCLAALLEWGVPFNVFYANEPQAMAALIVQGVRGILTDRPDQLLALREAQRRR